MGKTLTLLPLFGALVFGTASIAQATIIESLSGAPGCVNTASEGCQAKPGYVTGDGAGDPIHTVDFNNSLANDPFGVASYSSTGWQINGGSPPGGGDTSPYISINNNLVTITFSQAIDYFGFFWGSTDTYNSVQIYSDASLLGGFGGGPQGSANYVSFNATGGETFNKVVLQSTGCCFETDNHAYVIAEDHTTPEPGTLGTASSLLGVLAGYAMWRGRAARVA